MSSLNHPEPVAPAPRLELKALLLLAFMLALVLGSAVYVLYARGAFEDKARARHLPNCMPGLWRTHRVDGLPTTEARER